MTYKSLQECISDLNEKDEVLLLKKEVDPNIEMADLHLAEFNQSQKVLLFENVKNSKFKAVSNLLVN